MFACECTLEFHGQPFARDHCSPSRCPFHAANAHVHVSHRQPAVRARPLQHIEVAALRRTRARGCVPLAAVRARSLQHLEVPALRSALARICVPRAAVRM
jgi:hypothetical protein